MNSLIFDNLIFLLSIYSSMKSKNRGDKLSLILLLIEILAFVSTAMNWTIFKSKYVNIIKRSVT